MAWYGLPKSLARSVLSSSRANRQVEGGRLREHHADTARAKHLAELEMQARYHRDRHRLYAARMGGSRPFSLSKLRELKRMREVAESALSRAKGAKNG